MKDFLFKTFGVTFGTTLASFAARIVIALLMLFTGAATNYGDALGIILNKDRSIASAVALINEVPKKEIKAAVAEEDTSLITKMANSELVK